MAKIHKFELTDPEKTISFDIREGKILNMEGQHTDIFSKPKNIVMFQNLVPQIVELMNLNSINNFEITERDA